MKKKKKIVNKLDIYPFVNKPGFGNNKANASSTHKLSNVRGWKSQVPFFDTKQPRLSMGRRDLELD